MRSWWYEFGIFEVAVPEGPLEIRLEGSLTRRVEAIRRRVSCQTQFLTAQRRRELLAEGQSSSDAELLHRLLDLKSDEEA